MKKRRAESRSSSRGEPPSEKARPRRWRKWLLRLVLAVAAPTVILGGLEGLLRLVGVGYPTGFFLDVPESRSVMGNPRFAWRVFRPSIARTPLLLSFPAQKAAGTVRIFILGGSAAAGTPESTFHFGQILQAMLRHRYPHTRFEVINAAMTAINSHTVREIARNCAARQPDVFVVYMGNNEVVGPYGPGGGFAPFSPSLTTIRLSLWAKSTRTGQLLAGLLGGLGDRQPAGGWRGMEMADRAGVGPDDPRLENVYRHLRANLADICQAAHDASAKVVLCTVAVNLRDCPPFASRHRAGLSDADEARFQRFFDAGVARNSAGNLAAAVDAYQQALAVDGCHGETHFRLARCLEALARADEARRSYVRARDCDALRFRADSRINETIRQFAAEARGKADLVDFERELAKHPASPNGIPGDALFYEHVHLRFEGNYALAAAVFRKVAEILPLLSGPAGAPPSPATCAERIGWTPVARHTANASILHMTARPPFTGQLDHARRHARRQETVARLRQRLTPAVRARAAETLRRAVERDGDDVLLRRAYAELLLHLGRPKAAGEQWRDVLRRLPDEPTVAANLGTALSRTGQLDEALALYRRSLRNRPGDPGVFALMGAAYRKQGKPAEARQWLNKALGVDADHAAARLNLGAMAVKELRYTEAARQFARALRRRPYDREAYKGLRFVLRDPHRGPDALAALGPSLRREPCAAIHRAVAEACTALGRLDEATRHWTRAAELEPSPATDLSLARVLTVLGRDRQALTCLDRVLRTRPNSLPATEQRAWILATSAEAALRDGPRAEALAAAACRATRYRSPGALEALAAAAAEKGQFSQAVAAAEKALDLARKANRPAIVEQIAGRLRLYRAGRPYRRPTARSRPSSGPERGSGQ